MTQRKLKVGVIGLGIGTQHLRRGYQGNASVEITALADLDTVRMEKVAADYPQARCYATADEMFEKEELDLVSICTPNSLHLPLTTLALESGCHVLCEKPMAMSAAQAREMNAVAARTNRRIMIHFSSRFHQESLAMKAQVDTGVLGDIYFGRTLWHRRDNAPRFGGWFGIKALSGGGPLIDLGVHRLDLALWLMGFPKPTWVMAATYDPLLKARAEKENKPFDVEDLAVASIRFKNGATLLLETSWVLHQKEDQKMETSLYGTKGGMTLRNLNGGYTYEGEIYHETGGYQFDTRHQSLPAVPRLLGIDHYVDAILNDRPHIATGEEGLAVMELLDAIYESARLGAPVCLQDPADSGTETPGT